MFVSLFRETHHQFVQGKRDTWMTHHWEIYPLKIKPSRESAIEDMKEFGRSSSLYF